jgi:hypothetical protein
MIVTFETNLLVGWKGNELESNFDIELIDFVVVIIELLFVVIDFVVIVVWNFVVVVVVVVVVEGGGGGCGRDDDVVVVVIVVFVDLSQSRCLSSQLQLVWQPATSYNLQYIFKKTIQKLIFSILLKIIIIIIIIYKTIVWLSVVAIKFTWKKEWIVTQIKNQWNKKQKYHSPANNVDGIFGTAPTNLF